MSCLLEQDVIITNQVPDSIDVHPRGAGCDNMQGGCDFTLDTKIASYRYRVCGRCGTVRIMERR